jgi:starvation-inducible DNA-binding protein
MRAASLTNIFSSVLTVVLLAIVVVGVAAPPVSVLGIHPVTVLLVAAYGYRLVLSRKTSESPMWRPNRTGATEEDVPQPRREFTPADAGNCSLVGREEYPMPAPQSPIAPDSSEVAAQLQPVLIDLVALALSGKQAHWHVRGRLFTPVHEQLDTLVADVRACADEIAERIVALGIAADGRAHTVAELTSAFPHGFLADDKVVMLIVEQLDVAIDRARATIGPLETKDPVSQDLVLQLLRILEKHRWMFEAHTNTT